MKKTKVPTIDQQAQYAWMKDGKVDRHMIEEFLVRDLKGIHVLLTEMLSDKDVIDAITKVICDKYQKALEVQKSQPELPLGDMDNINAIKAVSELIKENHVPK